MSLILTPYSVAPATGGAVATDYDGAMRQSADSTPPTGVADSKAFVYSDWFRLDGGDGTEMALWGVGTNTGAGDDRFSVVRTAANKLRVIGKNSAASSILFQLSTPTYLAGSSWHHVLISCDLAATTCWMRIDDVLVALDTDVRTDDLIDFANTGPWNHAGYASAARFNGCKSEVFFHEGIFLADTEANRRKFITAALKPAYLGANGELPLGVQPRIYGPTGDLSGTGNKGTGGAFTNQGGTPGACSSAPGP